MEVHYMDYVGRYVRFTYNDKVLFGYCIMCEGFINTNRCFVAIIREEIEDDYLGFSRVIVIPASKGIPFERPVIDLDKSLLLDAKHIDRNFNGPPKDHLKDIKKRILSYKDIRLINHPEYFRELHVELHRLKGIYKLGKIDDNWPPRLKTIIDQISKLLWYSETRKNKGGSFKSPMNDHIKTPYKVFNPRPYSGGTFSPR